MTIQQNESNIPQTLSIRKPDDLHVHFRDDQILKVVAPYTAAQFARALVMPNLKPPVQNIEQATAYRQRILSALPAESSFTPLMTLYLTDQTTAQDIHAAHSSGFVKACKLYPAGATTNSAHGITSIQVIYDALHAMQQTGMILCIHGESTDPNVDIFDKEAQFVHDTLPKLLEDFPDLKIVLEHVTTSDAVDIVNNTPGNRLAATITAHHLLYSRQAIFANSKIHPHMFCLPVLKRESHRQALLAAISNDQHGKFFAGTDSAPHLKSAKICADGCAGIFTAHCAVELYAEAFQQAGVLHKLEAFLSENGARFYGLPINQERITLVRKRQVVPSKIQVPDLEPIIPLRADQTLPWSVVENSTVS